MLLWGLFLHLVSWTAVDRNIISLWHLSGGERDIRITCVVCALGMIPETVRLIDKRCAFTSENLMIFTWWTVKNVKIPYTFKEKPFKELTQAISRDQNISLRDLFLDQYELRSNHFNSSIVFFVKKQKTRLR